MKKTLQFAFSVLLILTALTSCKKGEDDPFLSLRSRKARIAGEWSVSSYNTKSYYTSVSATTITTTDYDGKTATTISKQDGVVTYENTTDYKENYVFKKDGTYTLTHTSTDLNYTITGTWYFLAKSKKNNLKNKEAVMVTVSSIIGNSNGSNNYTGNDGIVYTIQELRNKKMVLTSKVLYTSSDHVGEEQKTIVLSQD